MLALLLQPSAFSQAATIQPVALSEEQVFAPGSVPTAGTEVALRTLVAGLASGSPNYDKLSPQFAAVVRRDLPVTHPMFSSMGELKSMTFLGRDGMGGDVYNLVFANGAAVMSAGLDGDGRMAGGILRRLTSSAPAPRTETALRKYVAGLASGSPDYDKLSPQFAGMVRRTLPMTHPLFSSMGELKSMTFLGRGEAGDDVYDLVFAKGGARMSVALDADGRMTGGLLQPFAQPGR